MNPPPDRRALRTSLRECRRALPASIRIAAAESLAERLLTLPFMPTSGFVAGYWAVDGEIGLHAWQLRLPPTLDYCLPVLHQDGRLRFAPWKAGGALVTNRHGIPEPDVEADTLLEPERMSLVVLPLAGFDARCHRLGMGGGWYDRSFAFRQSQPAPPWLVGAAFAIQQLDHVESQDWDVTLDAVCCENATHIAKATA
ncbi:5-formyltetrahydrofolate cyclo-ligase [Thermomonas sp.]|uniref:5-formyltetrahydrofolate cyclo-ligase n=1 Tax=Thermomonas sp. TaxID=1971895 RepID=UPI002487F44B|nr:5-formyltetrahydrofolate cyclo-ligase [Thermomonas sp.]MDI1251724.1 5-formyltetrahydrofolate cyclo-ligase [Thermomonas sp.]